MELLEPGVVFVTAVLEVFSGSRRGFAEHGGDFTGGLGPELGIQPEMRFQAAIGLAEDVTVFQGIRQHADNQAAGAEFIQITGEAGFQPQPAEEKGVRNLNRGQIGSGWLPKVRIGFRSNQTAHLHSFAPDLTDQIRGLDRAGENLEGFVRQDIADRWLLGFTGGQGPCRQRKGVEKTAAG